MMRAFVLLSLAVLASANVLTLTTESFAEAIEKNAKNGILVKFYAPWCGHCKSLAPEWDKAAAAMGTDGARLAKIDCTEHQDICSQHGVQGYPTLKFFKEGSTIEYGGPREAAGIQKWIAKRSTASVVLADKDAFNSFVEKGSAIISVWPSDQRDAAAYQIWNAIRNQADFEDFEFAETNSEDVYNTLELEGGKAHIVVSRPGAKPVVFSGNFDSAEDWIQNNAFPLITDISLNRFPKLAQTKDYVVVLFTGADAAAEVELVTKVGSKFADKLGFVTGAGAQYAQHAPQLGLTGKTWPALVGVKRDKYFPLDEASAFSEANVEAFLSGLASGKAKSHFKSEPVPEKNDEPVFVVVGHNFEEAVTKYDGDVMLEFYAPWCGHCKSLAPIYEKLGEKYAGSAVRIAKIDATANDHPIEGISGFPTIKFFPKGAAAPIDYSGARTLEAMSAFIEEHKTGAAAKEEL